MVVAAGISRRAARRRSGRRDGRHTRRVLGRVRPDDVESGSRRWRRSATSPEVVGPRPGTSPAYLRAATWVERQLERARLAGAPAARSRARRASPGACRCRRRSVNVSPPAATSGPGSPGSRSARTWTRCRRRPARRTTPPASACCWRSRERSPGAAPGCRWCWSRSAPRSPAARRRRPPLRLPGLRRPAQRRASDARCAGWSRWTGSASAVLPVSSAGARTRCGDELRRRGRAGRRADVVESGQPGERPLVLRARRAPGRAARQHAVRRLPLGGRRAGASSIRTSSSGPPGWSSAGSADGPQRYGERSGARHTSSRMSAAALAGDRPGAKSARPSA